MPRRWPGLPACATPARHARVLTDGWYDNRDWPVDVNDQRGRVSGDVTMQWRERRQPRRLVMYDLEGDEAEFQAFMEQSAHGFARDNTREL